MTKEEREKAIDLLDDLLGMIEDNQGNDYDTVFKMCINLLQQEPCEDSISRQAVFETIDDCNSDGLKGIFCSYVDGERFKEYIKELPSIISKGVTVTDFADKCRECGKQKKGKWLNKEKIMFPICSKCGLTSVEKYNFCPNCGVEMKESEG